MLALLLFLLTLARAASLPGLPLVFQAGPDGSWLTAPEQPESVLASGIQPSWTLSSVDGQPFTDPMNAQRRVAAGPARQVQLGFQTPTGPVLVLVERAPLVQVEKVGVLPWPEGFALAGRDWKLSAQGQPALEDAQKRVWVLEPGTGALRAIETASLLPGGIPTVYWNSADAMWSVDDGETLAQLTVAQARERFGRAARLRSFQGLAAEHLLLAGPEGVEVYVLEWPLGTPELPVCSPRVPEGCLASGLRVLQEFEGKAGAREEALRQLGFACEQRVHRACYEAVAIEDERAAPRARACVEGDIAACNAVAERRLELSDGAPGPVVLGMLDFSCELEGKGTLGQRLRRLEDVGGGCMLLARAHDQLKQPDQALLNLDQACVLGRAEACEEASQRRHQAYALRTVRECEDEKFPVAASCVEQGRLLQKEKVPAASLDDFSAFLRGCTMGAIEGCVLLGDYVDRWGIDNPRVSEAETQLRRACNDGEQRACMGAAHLLVRHEPRSDAYGHALKLFTQACYEGLASACVAGAQQRRIGQAKRVEAPEPEAMWQQACQAADAEGCGGLGERLERSKKSWPQAYTAWSRACELGDPASCRRLGLLVERNRAEPWPEQQPRDSYLERACDSGDAEGCYWLAEPDLPRRGEPAESDYLLLGQSCQGEYGPGCARLAQVHLDRRTSFDDEIAARHLDAACQNGEFESCRLLGTLYLRGKGVERDRAKAIQLLEIFRQNAVRKHIRLGLSAGLPVVAGGEAEVVLPIPVGPALSVGGTFSYIPSGGTIFLLLRGESAPDDAPDLQVTTLTARLYPNNRARGVWGGIGFHQLRAFDGALAPRGVMTRQGFSVRLGVRNDNKNLYSGLELGMGSFGGVRIQDFDEDEKGTIPLVLPSIGVSGGVAF